ncbi:sporulation-delaying protein SdpB family protein [Psychroflexus sp. MBR-150]|jgi:antimicrobial peptide system SdpB family protein
MKLLILKSKTFNAYFLKVFYKKCDKIASRNYFTNVYGIARSLLAVGTLLTLLLNDTHILFPEHLFHKIKYNNFLESINLFFVLGYEYIWIGKVISILILVLVISGFYPRITGFFHWWISFSFFSSGVILDGGDQITTVLTLFLIPITLLDSRKNHWVMKYNSNKYKNFLAYIVFLIIELQVAILYLQASIEKPYKVQEWADGTAIYYWLNHNVFGTYGILLKWLNPLLDIPLFITIFNWGPIIFELSLFGAFFMIRKRRVMFLPFAIIFHFLIIIFHGLPSFFFAMSGALFLYLVPKNCNFSNFFRKKVKKCY